MQLFSGYKYKKVCARNYYYFFFKKKWLITWTSKEEK